MLSGEQVFAYGVWLHSLDDKKLAEVLPSLAWDNVRLDECRKDNAEFEDSVRREINARAKMAAEDPRVEAGMIPPPTR